MSQFFGSENIAKLIKSGSTTVQLVAGSNIRVGGQFYKLANTLSCDLSTSGIGGLDTGSIAVNKLYMIYAVVNGSNQIELIASLNVNSIGPTGYISWKLVGALLSDYQSQIGSTVTIEGVPTSDVFADGPIPITGVTTDPTKGTIVRDTIRWGQIGDKMEIHFEYEQSAGGSTGSGTYLLELRGGFAIDSSKIDIGVTSRHNVIVGYGHMSNALDGIAANSRETTISMYDSTHFQIATDEPTDSLDFFGSGGFAIVGQHRFSGKLTVPISGWSNIPLKDL